MWTAEGWVALLTLTMLEIVLGIDNIVFISILAGKLRTDQRARARTIGLALAMGMRIGLLLSIAWVMGLTAPWWPCPPTPTMLLPNSTVAWRSSPSALTNRAVGISRNPNARSRNESAALMS